MRFQVGVGTIDPGNKRMLERGGGADIKEEYPARGHASENCSQLCKDGMTWGGLCNWWWSLPDYSGYCLPHYFKCIEASAANPLNGLRIQFASQVSTLNIDPLIPQMNITDSFACLRM